jgi:Protoglobin
MSATSPITQGHTITDIHSRMAFHLIDEDVCRTIRDHQDFIVFLLPDVLDQFYRHVSSHDAIAQHFRDAAQMARAKSQQFIHWQRLVQAKFDPDYVAAVIRVGEVHFRLGIQPSHYMASYSAFLALLNARIAADYPGQFPDYTPDKLCTLIAAVTKITMLDMEYAISVYIDAGNSVFL